MTDPRLLEWVGHAMEDWLMRMHGVSSSHRPGKDDDGYEAQQIVDLVLGAQPGALTCPACGSKDTSPDFSGAIPTSTCTKCGATWASAATEDNPKDCGGSGRLTEKRRAPVTEEWFNADEGPCLGCSHPECPNGSPWPPVTLVRGGLSDAPVPLDPNIGAFEGEETRRYIPAPEYPVGEKGGEG